MVDFESWDMVNFWITMTSPIGHTGHRSSSRGYTGNLKLNDSLICSNAYLNRQNGGNFVYTNALTL